MTNQLFKYVFRIRFGSDITSPDSSRVRRKQRATLDEYPIEPELSSLTRVHVGRVKIQNNIDKENNVNNTINNEQRNIVQGFTLECGMVGNEQRRIKR